MELNTNTKTQDIIDLAGEYYDSETDSVTRESKSALILIDFANIITGAKYAPNTMNRDVFTGHHRFYKWSKPTATGSEVIRGYYPQITNKYTGRSEINMTNGTIEKSGDYWKYTLTDIKINPSIIFCRGPLK